MVTISIITVQQHVMCIAIIVNVCTPCKYYNYYLKHGYSSHHTVHTVLAIYH